MVLLRLRGGRARQNRLTNRRFRHETSGVRLYTFEAVVAEGIRKDLLVTAAINLLTKHRVRIQEVPMMCLRLLESAAATEPQPDSMVIQAKAAERERAASKRTKRPFKPANPVAFGMALKS